jgi:hypothetical protein
MQILDFDQSDEELFKKHRMGVITMGTDAAKIITEKTLRLSASHMSVVYKKLAEIKYDVYDEIPATYWMQRGTEMESYARNAYCLQTCKDVKEVGMVKTDDGRKGCSPDGIIMDFERIDSGVEIKCPSGTKQMQRLVENVVPPEYIPQIQGSMWITGAHKWDFYSWHPDMDSLLITVKRDDNYIERLSAMVEKVDIKIQRYLKELV